MGIKSSLEENKDEILNSLPTQELKDEFLKSLDSVEETAAPSVEDQVSEAQAPDHVSEDMYDGIKQELESYTPVAPPSEEEQQAMIDEAMKNPPSSGEENNYDKEEEA